MDQPIIPQSKKVWYRSPRVLILFAFIIFGVKATVDNSRAGVEGFSVVSDYGFILYLAIAVGFGMLAVRWISRRIRLLIGTAFFVGAWIIGNMASNSRTDHPMDPGGNWQGVILLASGILFFSAYYPIIAKKFLFTTTSLPRRVSGFFLLVIPFVMFLGYLMAVATTSTG